MDSVAFHHPHQHVQKQLFFVSPERIQDSIVGLTNPGKAATPQLPALRRYGEFAGPAIGVIHRPLQKTPRFELVGDQTDIVAVDPKRLGQRLLADAGHVVDEHQQGILKLDQAGIFQGDRNHALADLLKPSNKRRQYAANGNTVASENRC